MAWRRTPVHSHEWPATLYMLNWSDFIRYDPDGNSIPDNRTMGASLEPGTAQRTPPPQYVNIGDGDLHVIAIELNLA